MIEKQHGYTEEERSDSEDFEVILGVAKLELLEMLAEDQGARKSGRPFETTDECNTAKLKEIIAEIGWPTIPKVGLEAAKGAFLVAQHAEANVEFMEDCFDLMKQTEEGEIVPAWMAYLEDRLLMFRGEPQVYGTQYKNNELYPVIDPENLDARRASVGLGLSAEYEAIFRDGRYKRLGRALRRRESTLLENYQEIDR